MLLPWREAWLNHHRRSQPAGPGRKWSGWRRGVWPCGGGRHRNNARYNSHAGHSAAIRYHVTLIQPNGIRGVRNGTSGVMRGNDDAGIKPRHFTSQS